MERIDPGRKGTDVRLTAKGPSHDHSAETVSAIELVPPGGIPSLDGLRAVSITFVFASHAGVSDLIPGGFGVTVFFFLSGFLITRLFCAEFEKFGRVSIGAFFVRRLLRLSPPLFVSLTLIYGLVAIGVVPGGMDWDAVLSQFLYFHNYYSVYSEAPGAVAKGTSVLWSLAVEEHFYLIWPLVFVAFSSKRIGLGAIGWSLLLILAWRTLRGLAFGEVGWSVYVSTDTRLDSILFGCLLALMDWRGLSARVFPSEKRAMIVSLSAAVAVLLFCFLYRDPLFRSTIRFTLQGLALMPVFYYCVAAPQAWFARPLNWGWMRALGRYSYTIYLVHFVTILTLQELFSLAYEDRVAVAPLALALTVAWASALYHTIEAPARRVRRRLSRSM